MPISAERQKLYPGGSIRSVAWRALRSEILVRARNRCEGTAQRPACRAKNDEPHPETSAIVVLTIAHLDQDPGNNAPSNLAALCQLCHNRWDQVSRTRNAIASRRRRLGEGTLDLFACEAIEAPADQAPARLAAPASQGPKP